MRYADGYTYSVSPNLFKITNKYARWDGKIVSENSYIFVTHISIHQGGQFGVLKYNKPTKVKKRMGIEAHCSNDCSLKTAKYEIENDRILRSYDIWREYKLKGYKEEKTLWRLIEFQVVKILYLLSFFSRFAAFFALFVSGKSIIIIFSTSRALSFLSSFFS